MRSWLSDEAHGKWLLIIDNVDNEIAVELKDGQKLSLSSLLPQSGNGAILVTSRGADVARRLVGREQDTVEIGAIINNDATQLLQAKRCSAEWSSPACQGSRLYSTCYHPSSSLHEPIKAMHAYYKLYRRAQGS